MSDYMSNYATVPYVSVLPKFSRVTLCETKLFAKQSKHWSMH